MKLDELSPEKKLAVLQVARQCIGFSMQELEAVVDAYGIAHETAKASGGVFDPSQVIDAIAEKHGVQINAPAAVAAAKGDWRDNIPKAIQHLGLTGDRALLVLAYLSEKKDGEFSQVFTKSVADQLKVFSRDTKDTRDATDAARFLRNLAKVGVNLAKQVDKRTYSITEKGYMRAQHLVEQAMLEKN